MTRRAAAHEAGSPGGCKPQNCHLHTTMNSLHFPLSIVLTALLFAFSPVAVRAQAPGIVSYQGQITANGTSYSGTGQFRFIIWRDGPPVTLWSHDGTSAGGEMPASAVALPVTDGLFSVGMGDTAVPGMALAVPAGIFQSAGLRVRIWFSDGVAEPALVADHAITSVGYALFAAGVADGSITVGKIASGAVTSAQLADDITVENLRIASGALETVTLDAAAGAGQGALFTLRNGFGTPTFLLDADTASRGSALVLREMNQVETVHLQSSTGAGLGARLDMKNGFARTTISANADSGGRAGVIAVYNNDEKLAVVMDGDEGNGAGGVLTVHDAGGSQRARLDGQGTNGGGALELFKADGTKSVSISADIVGEGRVTTQVLEITGGADFAENFDIQSADTRPGMIVSIDPEHPGELTISRSAYDRTVAGVVSGAGGVKPGLMMGQRGTRADGAHPVALTGRVYCLVDADHGAIAPGDLITTSDTPGHGMKAADHTLSPGTIIGKAMTGLSSGRGLVLVLVSLQ